MKREDLISLGIAEDAIDKIMALNGADIEKQKSNLDTLKADISSLRSQLADANKQIDEFKGMDIEGIKKAADDWKSKYDAKEKEYTDALAKRDYEDAIKTEIADLKFSSEFAKKAFVSALKEKQLKLENGKLIGFADVLKQAQTDDPSAFTSGKQPPQFTDPMGGKGKPEITKEAFAKMTYMEKLKIKTEQPEVYKGLMG